MLNAIFRTLAFVIACSLLPGTTTKVRACALKNATRSRLTSARTETSGVSDARFARLRRGINLSHWFAQSFNKDYSQAHLETHTTAQDMALVKAMGFDHVRFTIEPAPLLNTADPSALNDAYLRYLDGALDMILAHDLAVIVDIHPSDEFKLGLNKDDRYTEAFVKFWRALAGHLSTRDPERTFLEVLNEPMVEDGYRWMGIQARLIAAIRAGAPRHTIIATGHRWSGINELLFLEPVADPNVVYNFHFYEPFAFTHQGATWAGPHLSFYKNVPYPSSPEAVARIMDTIPDEAARLNLLRYGEERWSARRIEAEIAVAAEWAQRHHVRLTCNEFGAFRKVVTPSDRAVWIRDVRGALEKYGIGWAMWDYAGGFAVVNKQGGRAAPDAETVRALGLRVPGE